MSKSQTTLGQSRSKLLVPVLMLLFSQSGGINATRLVAHQPESLSSVQNNVVDSGDLQLDIQNFVSGFDDDESAKNESEKQPVEATQELAQAKSQAETKVDKTQKKWVQESEVNASDFNPLTVGLLSGFSVLACCFFSQVLAAGAKKSKLRLNKYYQRKKYEKDKLIQYISQQQHEEAQRNEKEVVLRGFADQTQQNQQPGRISNNSNKSSEYMSQGERISANKAKREARRQRSQFSSDAGMRQSDPATEQIRKQGPADNAATANESSSYMTYNQMQADSAYGASRTGPVPQIAKYRESSRRSKDVARAKRDSSWDSAKDDENERSRVSKRSNTSSAYDKYNLADTHQGAETEDDAEARLIEKHLKK